MRTSAPLLVDSSASADVDRSIRNIFSGLYLGVPSSIETSRSLHDDCRPPRKGGADTAAQSSRAETARKGRARTLARKGGRGAGGRAAAARTGAPPGGASGGERMAAPALVGRFDIEPHSDFSAKIDDQALKLILY